MFALHAKLSLECYKLRKQVQQPEKLLELIPVRLLCVERAILN